MRLSAVFVALIALFGSVTPAQAQPMPQCGQVITTNFTLMGDWGCGNGPALIVGANGLRINLNGHTLSGNPAIRMRDVEGTTVRNGTIPSPIDASNAPNSRFVDMAIGWPDGSAGYYWDGTTSATFVRTSLDMWRLHCGVRCVLRESGGRLNQLTANELVMRGGSGGINYLGAHTIDIVDYSLFSLRLGGSERLTVRNSRLQGTEIIATGRIELLNNTFSGGHWLGVHNPVSGIIRGNRFEKMSNLGLFVQPKSALKGPLLIERNTFAENRNDGLRIDIPLPLDITVRKNTSENNGRYGMWASEGSVVDGGKNVSNNDALGCFTIICGLQGE